MGRNKKKPFIDKKNSSTYHLLYRSQRDVAEEATDNEAGTASADAGVILWPSPDNNKATDKKVLLGKSSADAGGTDIGEDHTIQKWKSELSQAGLVDEYDYEKHMKPITGTGVFFDSSGNRGGNALADVRSKNVQEDLVKEVDRQLESITLTPECMDDDIAQALFGDFNEDDFEELNDEFVLDAAEAVDGEEEASFDFAAHIQGLMEKAKMEREGIQQLATIHEQGQEDQAFFSRGKALTDKDNEEFDEFADLDDGMEGGWHIDGAPGVVPKLSETEEKALCDKFEATLLEYDSDDIGEGADDEEAMGPLPLEGDQKIESALDEYLEGKNDGIFMAGARHYLESENGLNGQGGSGFAALVGTKMIPAKDLDESANVQGDIRPITEVLGEADEIIGGGRHAPPAEEIFIDGKSYFSEKMRNPWDCESILSTYSNLDNNPVTIDAGSSRRRRKNRKKGSSVVSDDQLAQNANQQILLSDKTGLPLNALPVREEEEEDEDFGMDTYMSVNKGEARKKNESREEKRLRKLTVKKEREMARMQKKMMKEAFNDEFTKRQHEVLVDDVGGKSVFRF